MRYVFDFCDGLPPELKKRLRQTGIYRRFIKERKRASTFANQYVADGGKMSDPEILKEAKDVEALGAQMQEKIREIQTEIEKYDN